MLEIVCPPESSLVFGRTQRCEIRHKATIPQGARHVQRKALKMRELHHLRRATVALIKTDENAADLFTKALDNQTFHRHRATIMNLAAAK